MKVKILGELASVLKDVEEFTGKAVISNCSKYLKEIAHSQGFKNEDVYFLLRFAVTGNPVGAPVGDICEIIGKEQTLQRLEEAGHFLKKEFI